MRCLVTGAAGFIGRHFLRRLRAEGHQTLGVDIRSGTNLQLDVRDFFARQGAGSSFDLVVHCAAVIGGRLGIEGNPAHLMAEDLSIDAALFRWALQARPGRIIYFSSSAAYPAALQTPERRHALREGDIDLDDVASPDHCYGWVKLTGEQLARYALDEGLRVHVFRPFSGYGEDQSLDYPFPSFIDRAARRDDPFEVWGDGTAVRDWIHVDDIVGAVMAALHYDIEGPVNLGWGEPVSFGELAMSCMEAAGYHPDIALRSDRPSGVAYRCAEVSRMLSFYAPRVTLEEGIARALHSAQVAA